MLEHKYFVQSTFISIADDFDFRYQIKPVLEQNNVLYNAVVFDEAGIQLVGMTSTEFLNLSDAKRVETLNKLVERKVWLMVTISKTNANMVVSSIVQNMYM